MDDIYIKVIPTYPELEQLIKDIMADKLKRGDKTPLFVAPDNPNSPEGKQWKIGVKVGNEWMNQAGFGDEENGEPTGALLVRLKGNSSGPPKSSSSGGFAPKKDYAKQSYYAKR